MATVICPGSRSCRKPDQRHAQVDATATPKAIHVRKHGHSANETHTMILGTAVFQCDCQRAEIGPGGFNFMPARMVHEA